jgi:lysine decarboxylase
LLTLDVTEIDGTDNMHHPTEAILEAEKLIATLNDCDKSLFLVNGGSSGVLTSILGTLSEGDKLIICRNAHKSAYNAMVLSGVVPVYVSPEVLSGTIPGGITPEALERAFTMHTDAKAVFITSPSYEGIVSDINSLAEIAHRHNAILIVDETHGAHFAFSDKFPKPAIALGADISINSWHKTLPCPNQSAVINFNTARIDLERLTDAYSMVQSTSPSYIMLTLMDKVRAILCENRAIVDDYIGSLTEVRQLLSKLKNMRLLGCDSFQSIFDYDIGKLVMLTGKNLSGKALAQTLLKEYNIQIELADTCHIIAMTSVADTHEALMSLARALIEIDKTLAPYEPTLADEPCKEVIMPEVTPRRAFYSGCKVVSLQDSIGKLAGECVTPFPPDIPLIITGERITARHIDAINRYRRCGTTVIGADNNKIRIIEVM